MSNIEKYTFEINKKTSSLSMKKDNVIIFDGNILDFLEKENLYDFFKIILNEVAIDHDTIIKMLELHGWSLTFTMKNGGKIYSKYGYDDIIVPTNKKFSDYESLLETSVRKVYKGFLGNIFKLLLRKK